jgi:hypothetical protein
MKTSTYILWLLLLFATLFFSGCAKKNQESKPIVSTWNALSGYHTLFVLWDSLSAWYQLPLEKSYPMLVEKKLLALWYRIKVINGWESGDTSAGLKERIARITADAHTGDIALVVIGGNDGLQWLDTDALWKISYLACSDVDFRSLYEECRFRRICELSIDLDLLLCIHALLVKLTVWLFHSFSHELLEILNSICQMESTRMKQDRR